MALPLANIRIGQPNQAANSDSLWQAFNTTQNNFAILANQASPWTQITGNGNIGGLSVVATAANTLEITNTGVTQVVAGNGISITSTGAGGTGVVTVTNTGGGGNGTSLTGVSITGTSGVTVNPNGVPLTSNIANFTLSLSNSGVTAGSYRFPNITVDSTGRVTNISNGTAGTITGIAINNGGNLGLSITGSPVSNGNANITITNTGVTRLNVGAGLTLSNATGNTGNSLTGDVTLTLTGGGGGGGGTVTRIGMVSSGEIYISSNAPPWNSTSNTQSYSTDGTFFVRLNPYQGPNSSISTTGITHLGDLIPDATSGRTFALRANGNVIINGNLQVTGNTTYVDSNVVVVQDPVIILGQIGNSGGVGPNGDRGTLLRLQSGLLGFMGYQTGSGEFVFGNRVDFDDATNVISNVIYGNVRANNYIAQNSFTTIGSVNAGNANITTNAIIGFANITGNANVGGNLNVTANAIISNNITVGGNYTTTTGNIVTNSGNIVATTGSLVGNLVSNISIITGNLTLSGPAGSYIDVVNGNIFANLGTIRGSLLTGTLTTASQPNITTLANNLTIGNIANAGFARFNSNVETGTLRVTGDSNVTGNLSLIGTTPSYIAVANGNVYANSGIIRGNLLEGVLNVNSNSQPNITSVGNLTNLTVGDATSNVRITAGNITANGYLIASNVTANNLTQNRVVLAGINGFITDSANLTFTGTTFNVISNTNITGSANITANLIIGGATNVSIGGGNVVAADRITANFIVANNTNTVSYGVLYANGTSGLIDNDANLTFDSTTLTLTGVANITSNLIVGGGANITGNLYLGGGANIANLTLRNISNTQIPIANVNGFLAGSGNLTFSGTQLTVTGGFNATANANVGTTLGVVNTTTVGNIVSNGTGNIGSTLGVGGVATVNQLDSNLSITGANVTANNLTQNRVLLAGASGLITDSANLLFTGTALTVTGTANIEGIVRANSQIIANANISTNNTLIAANVIANNTVTASIGNITSINSNTVNVAVALNVTSTTVSSSTGSGAVIVAGGVGIGGNISVGTNANIVSTVFAANANITGTANVGTLGLAGFTTQGIIGGAPANANAIVSWVAISTAGGTRYLPLYA